MDIYVVTKEENGDLYFIEAFFDKNKAKMAVKKYNKEYHGFFDFEECSITDANEQLFFK